MYPSSKDQSSSLSAGLPVLGKTKQPSKAHNVYEYESPISSLRPQYTGPDSRLQPRRPNSSRQQGGKRANGNMCSVQGCARPKIGVGKSYCSMHYVSASLRDTLGDSYSGGGFNPKLAKPSLGKLQNNKMTPTSNHSTGRDTVGGKKKTLKPLAYHVERNNPQWDTDQVPLHAEYVANPFSRHKVIRLYSSPRGAGGQPGHQHRAVNGITHLSDVLNSAAANSAARPESPEVHLTEDGNVDLDMQAREEAVEKRKQADAKRKEERAKETYQSIIRFSPNKKQSAVGKQRRRRVMLVQQLKEKEKRLAALMSTHQGSFEVLGGFLKKRPTRRRLEQTNILKNASSKGHKQIGSTLENFFNVNRPSQTELENRNIIKVAKKDMSERANSFAKTFDRRESPSILRHKNILLDAKDSAALSKQLAANKLNLGKRLLNRPAMDSSVIRNVQTGKDGQVKSMSSGLAKLLKKRPLLKFLTQRNIIKDKAQEANERELAKMKQSKITQTLRDRPSILQMKQKGVLHSTPGVLAARVGQKKRQFAFRERQNSLSVLLSARVDPEKLLQMTTELEQEQIAATQANKQFKLVESKQRRRSFFDGVNGQGAETNPEGVINPTSISELVRIDHVIAEHRRHQEQDKGSTGGVYMWGTGSKELGLGDVKIVLRPQLLKNLMKEVITMVACGKGHTLALTRTGYAFAWGANQWGQLGLSDMQNRTQPFSTKFRASPLYDEPLAYVAAGEKTSGAVTKTGDVFMWGYAKDGALGCGAITKDAEPLPCRVKALNGKHMKQLALGSRHTAGVTENGVLYSWGIGSTGALGHPEQKNYNKPKVLEKYMEFFDYVDCGRDFTAAIGFDGSVYTWGKNDQGQLGHNGDTAGQPTPVMSLWRKHITKVKCGLQHAVAITDEGGVYSTIVSSDKKQAKFHRMVPGRVLCDVTAGWDDTVVGMTPDGRKVTWDATDGSLMHDAMLLHGKTITAVASGESFFAAIGTWHLEDEVHQNSKNAHLPVPSSNQRLKQKHTHRARKASLALVPEQLTARQLAMAALASNDDPAVSEEQAMQSLISERQASPTAGQHKKASLAGFAEATEEEETNAIAAATPEQEDEEEEEEEI